MSSPTTAYAVSCTNCGYAQWTPNPNINAPRLLGLASNLKGLPPTTCPHCGSQQFVPVTVSLP